MLPLVAYWSGWISRPASLVLADERAVAEHDECAGSKRQIPVCDEEEKLGTADHQVYDCPKHVAYRHKQPEVQEAFGSRSEKVRCACVVLAL
jgi:hypothetical protein